MKTCQWTEYECPHYCEGQTNFCGSHNLELRKRSLSEQRNALKKRPAKIQQVSPQMKNKLRDYPALKKQFMIGKTCPVYPELPVEDVHHMKGRAGMLLLNPAYWLAVSRKGHIKITNNPKWALEMGFSLPRQ